MDSVRLSPRLFFFIGSGIMYADSEYSNPITYTAGRDSWLVMLMGGLTAIACLGWVGSRVVHAWPDGAAVTARPFPGGLPWRALHLLVAIWAWCVAGWSLHRFSEFIQNETMPMTPLLVFLASLCFVTIWAGRYGLEAGGRMITICSLAIFPLPFTYILLLLGHVHPQWLLPVAQESDFWFGFLIALSFFLQAAPLFVLFSLVEDRQKALLSLFAGLALCIVFATVVRAVVIAVLNPYLAPYYAAPDYAAIRLIRLTESINRVELPLVWLWSYASWAKVLLYFLLGTYALLVACGTNRWNKAYLASAALFIAVTAVFLTRPDGFGLINFLEARYLYYINLGFQLIFMLAMTGMALYWNKKKRPPVSPEGRGR